MDKDTRKSCFVIMPFNEVFDQMYDLAIKPAIEAEGFQCIRGDTPSGAGIINAEIVKNIHKVRFTTANASPKIQTLHQGDL